MYDTTIVIRKEKKLNLSVLVPHPSMANMMHLAPSPQLATTAKVRRGGNAH